MCKFRNVLLALGLIVGLATSARAASYDYSCTAVGNGPQLQASAGDTITYSVSGTFVGTAILQRRVGADAWAPVVSATSSASGTFLAEPLSNATGAVYRFRCDRYTSGTIVTSLSNAADEVTELYGRT